MGANLSKKTLVGSDVSDLFSLPSLRGTDAAREKIQKHRIQKYFWAGAVAKIFFSGAQRSPADAVSSSALTRSCINISRDGNGKR